MSEQPKHRGYWIFSPLQDMAFVLLTPVPILLAFVVAGHRGWVDGLITLGLAMAMGHYLPGILRAYGDRSLFRRFKLRLILAPVFLTGVTTYFAWLNLHVVLFLAAVWGLWHWMMQSYGFARIYDARVAPDARTPAWLDQAICLLWFGMAVFVLNNDLPSYVTRFYEGGGPELPREAFVWFVRAWLAMTVLVTGYYLVRLVRAIRDRKWPNPLKLLFFAVTMGYLAYTVSIMERPKMGLVMFELWHDIQYLAIVWMFNLRRTTRAPEAGPFFRFLFRPRLSLALAYVCICVAFGWLTHAWILFENPVVVRVVASLVTATALLHYYMDGFIWKIRETETGETLGVRAITAGPGPSRSPRPAGWPSWLRQAALWPLFVIPAVLLFASESKGKVVPILVYQNVAAAFPNSAEANYQLGRELQDVGRFSEARTHFERALATAPDMLPAHIFLGVLLADKNDLTGARPHFERSLQLDPNNAEVHNNLAIVLEGQGDLEGARRQIEAAVSLNPEYSLAHNNFGLLLNRLGDIAQARTHFERAISIDPDFADAHFQLGRAMLAASDLSGAADHFRTVLRIDPLQYQAHNSLGEVLARQGKLADAKAHFEEALKIRPGYSAARQNLFKTDAELLAEDHGRQ